jgi:hypothetical protein
LNSCCGESKEEEKKKKFSVPKIKPPSPIYVFQTPLQSGYEINKNMDSSFPSFFAFCSAWL